MVNPEFLSVFLRFGRGFNSLLSQVCWDFQEHEDELLLGLKMKDVDWISGWWIQVYTDYYECYIYIK